MRRKLVKQTIAAMTIAALGLGALTGCGSSGAKESTQPVEAADDSGEEASEEASTENVSSADANEQTDEQADTSELKEFRIGVPGQDDAYVGSLLNVAYYEGYLKEELNAVGYEPSLVAALTGPVLNESLAAKEIEATVYGDFPAFTAAANGLGNEIVAVVDSKYQYGVLTADDLDITDPTELEGKTVSVTQGTVLQFFWDQYVKANGIDSSSINIVNSTDMSTLFQTGDIDAGVTTIASAYYFEKLGVGAKVFDTGADQAYSTLVATVRGDILDEDPEVGVAFNKALIRAYDAVKADASILYKDQETASIDAATWEKAQAFDTSLDNLKVQITDNTLAFYDELNQWLVDNQVITNAVDLDEFIHTEYYEQAASELGK